MAESNAAYPIGLAQPQREVGGVGFVAESRLRLGKQHEYVAVR
jgi:hypothetical protein